jgi:hypothetical protein
MRAKIVLLRFSKARPTAYPTMSAVRVLGIVPT